ncbi:MAG: hypothetical protein LBV75_09355 [Paludibacter sp.]|jgi:hypothetical protein|nr:hypothetical protein [Paludibacter sp.]
MKKLILALFVLLLAQNYCLSQSKIFVGGGISVYGNESQKMVNTSFEPEIGYVIGSRYEAGLIYSFKRMHSYDYEFDGTSNSISGFFRFFFADRNTFNFGTDIALSYSNTDKSFQQSFDYNRPRNGFEFGFKPLMTYQIGNHTRLIFQFGFIGIRQNYSNFDNMFGANFSFNEVKFAFNLY